MKPYRIKLYSKNNVLETVFAPSDCYLQSYEKTLNKAGKAVLKVPLNSKIAIKTNFQKMKRIKVFRWNPTTEEYLPKWTGFIEEILEDENFFNIGCTGLLDVFLKRFTTATQAITGTGGTEALDLLDQTNIDDDTYIDRGSTDYTEAVDLKADRKSILKVWEDILKAENGEVEITEDTCELNFYKTIGTDKSTSIILKYKENRSVENNLERIKVNESGGKIINKLYARAKNSGGTQLESIVPDPASIIKYGLLEDVHTFTDVETQDQLDVLAQAYLDTYSEEIDNPEIRMLQKRSIVDIVGNSKEIGIDLDDIEIGDIITLKYQTAYNEISQTRRIINIQVQIDDNGNENINIKLSDPDQKVEILSEKIDEEASKTTQKRLEDLERKVF